ncbi:hypothetical protein [Paraburkholderia phenoliruptrix]|uniref:hypothetical protein n=1 Tax=Paraburkholderia phenoliruptrix TaxID=252970 RepID=UPI003D995B38
MTMRTYTHLECWCGHKGMLKLSENDSIYSEEWSREEYIDGDHTGAKCGMTSTFEKEKTDCPGCGTAYSKT